MLKRILAGHLLALLTIFMWGMTFIASKILLHDFTPVEILFYRFTLGFIALLVMVPHIFPWQGLRQEVYYMGAGLCGVLLYFLLENTALTYTYASNVGIIIAASPFLTALLAHVFLREERLSLRFFCGFALAISGIVLIFFNGNVNLHLNPLGDMLAAGASLTWACYSILMSRIGTFGQNNILCTRRVFLYALIFTAPLLPVLGAGLDMQRILRPANLGNLLFLGIGASALGYMLWNWCVRVLGAIRTSVYLYLMPVVTVLAAVIILQETITGLAMLGIAMTLAGLALSEKRRPAQAASTPDAPECAASPHHSKE